jgi:cytochrome b involved in lipid metabolism
MKYALLIGLAVLLFGCVVQPTGPLEESLKPPAGLDVEEALDNGEGKNADETVEGNESSNNAASGANESAANETGIDSTELSRHSSPSDCWVVYDGEVYDVTSYLLRHPGGSQPIADHCGKDGSSFKEAFEGQHGISKVDGLKTMGVYVGSYMGD